MIHKFQPKNTRCLGRIFNDDTKVRKLFHITSDSKINTILYHYCGLSQVFFESDDTKIIDSELINCNSIISCQDKKINVYYVTIVCKLYAGKLHKNLLFALSIQLCSRFIFLGASLTQKFVVIRCKITFMDSNHKYICFTRFELSLSTFEGHFL